MQKKNISLSEKISEASSSYYTHEKEEEIDRFLGIDTVGFYFPKKDHTKYASAIPYQTFPYPKIDQLISFLKTRPEIINKETVLGGIGIGKGRLEFSLAAEISFKKIIGIEAFRELATAAEKNFKNLRVKKNPDLECEIILGDALGERGKIPEADTYIMYKPFRHKAIYQWLCNLEKYSTKNSYIIYIQEPLVDENIKYLQKTLNQEGERVTGTDIWIFKTALPGFKKLP